MPFGTITLGRLVLRENWSVEQTSAGVLTVSGQESTPPLTQADANRRREDILGVEGALLPVTFTDKPLLSGYYRVSNTKATYAEYFQVTTIDWTLTLDRFGTESEIDLESRLSGPLTRNTAFAVTGERWHSPPVGHYGYWSGSTVPSVVTRAGADGAQVVYRNVPATHPRWGSTPSGCLVGRVRFLDDAPAERSGLNFAPSASGWELSNGLVRVRALAASGVLDIAAYTGGAWRSKAWDLLAGGVTLGVPRSATLLRNELEQVVVRLLWASTAPGRVTADLTLTRGARVLELYVQSQTSTTLKVVRAATEAGTAGTGYVRATANDADGNRYVVGSALAFTNDTVTGGLSKAATTTLDTFVGVAAAGSGAVAGDQPDTLMAQYLGTPGELVVPVRR
jgi:hypothetical protein